jgi:competence protein ComEC
MKQKRMVVYSGLGCGVMIIVVCVVALYYMTQLKYTQVIFLNVGQGDAIFVAQGTHQILIDGGADGVALQEELGRHMPFWDRTIDIVVATHPDSDHIDGLISVFKNYTVHQFWHTEAGKDTSQYVALMHMAHRKEGMEDVLVRNGVEAYLADYAHIRAVYPFTVQNNADGEDVNDESIAMIMTIGDEKFYLGGDLPIEYEDILPIDTEVTVLKASHHGSQKSTSEFFLNKLHPRDVVISVGKDNRYGHPHKDVIDRSMSINANIYRTDENGTIEYRCDDHTCQLFLQKQ